MLFLCAGGFNPPRRPPSCAYKAPGDPSFVGASFSFLPACVTPPLLFCNLFLSLVWIGDLISMVSKCFQPIAHSCTPHKSIAKLGFQFPNPPQPSDASVFGCAARFNLSGMDTPASMNDLRSQAPPAVGQRLPSARTASPSEDGPCALLR